MCPFALWIKQVFNLQYIGCSQETSVFSTIFWINCPSYHFAGRILPFKLYNYSLNYVWEHKTFWRQIASFHVTLPYCKIKIHAIIKTNTRSHPEFLASSQIRFSENCFTTCSFLAWCCVTLKMAVRETVKRRSKDYFWVYHNWLTVLALEEEWQVMCRSSKVITFSFL